MKLAAALGYFSGDERRDEQRRLVPFFASCFDQRRSGEAVDRFDLGVETVLATFNEQIDYGIGAAVVPSWGRPDLGVNPGRLLERLSSAIQDSSFGGCHRHGSTRYVQYL